MNKTNVYLWFLSVAILASNIFMLMYFAYNTNRTTSVYCFLFFVVSVSFYLIMTKISTHPKSGYTCVQAMFFYIICKKNGITTLKDCNNRFNEVQKIAKKYDFSKNLDKQDLFDLFKNGKNIYKE